MSKDNQASLALNNLSSEEIFKILETTEKLEEALKKDILPLTLFEHAHDLAQFLIIDNDENLNTSLINLKIIADNIKFSKLTLYDKVTTANIIDDIKAQAHPDIIYSCQELIESYESYIGMNGHPLWFYERLHFFLRLNDKTMAKEFLIKFSSHPLILPLNLLIIIEDEIALNNFISLLVKTEKIDDGKDKALDFIAFFSIDEIERLKDSLQFDVMSHQTKDLRNILYSTIRYGTLENLTILLKNLKDSTIDINSRDSTNLTPLEFAFKYATPEKVQILLDYPTIKFEDINNGSYIELKNLQTILEHPKISSIESHNFLAYFMKDRINLLELMTSTSINVDSIKSKSGNTPLFYALENNNKELVKSLLKNPTVDINHKNTDGNTLLQDIINYLTIPMLKIMLSNPKIDVNNRNIYGCTILHTLIGGEPSILKILLQHPEIDVNLLVTDPEISEVTTVLDLASRVKNLNGIQLLLQHPKINVTKNLYGLSSFSPKSPNSLWGLSLPAYKYILPSTYPFLTRTSHPKVITIQGDLDSLSEEENIELWTSIIQEYELYSHLHQNPFFKEALSKWEHKARILSSTNVPFVPDPTPQNSISPTCKIL